MNKNYEKYLPIGTVVMLKGGTKRVMITGFCVSTESNKNEIYDYSGCIYPEGYLSSNQNCLFNHEQIQQIYFLGFVDDEEEEFKGKLNQFLKNIETVEKNQVSETTTNNSENLTVPQQENAPIDVVSNNLNTENNIAIEIPSIDNNVNSTSLDSTSQIVIPDEEENLESDSTGFPTFNTTTENIAPTNVFIPNVINDTSDDTLNS